jgi:hypothetical protein
MAWQIEAGQTLPLSCRINPQIKPSSDSNTISMPTLDASHTFNQVLFQSVCVVSV